MFGGFVMMIMIVWKTRRMGEDLLYDVFRGEVDDLVLEHDQRGPGKSRNGFYRPNEEAGVPTVNPAHDYHPNIYVQKSKQSFPAYISQGPAGVESE